MALVVLEYLYIFCDVFVIFGAGQHQSLFTCILGIGNFQQKTDMQVGKHIRVSKILHFFLTFGWAICSINLTVKPSYHISTKIIVEIIIIFFKLSFTNLKILKLTRSNLIFYYSMIMWDYVSCFQAVLRVQDLL